jgi:hypothetical protein
VSLLERLARTSGVKGTPKVIAPSASEDRENNGETHSDREIEDGSLDSCEMES